MQHQNKPQILGFNLDPESGFVTLKIKGDLGTYETGLDHPVVEIFNAVMDYAISPIRLAAARHLGEEMEYIRFIPEFPVYCEEDNLTVCKFDPCNNHGTRSQLIFITAAQRTFCDFCPILTEALKSFFKRPAGYDLYEQKLAQIKSIDRQMATIRYHIDRSNDPNHIAKTQSHLANLEEARERKAIELKEGLKDFLQLVGLPIPASKIKYHDDFASRVADLLDAGEKREASMLIIQKNYDELLTDYAEDDPA